MGYALNILIAHPDKRILEKHMPFLESERRVPTKTKTCMLWQITEVVPIGRVTRIAKIADPQFKHLHSNFTGKHRAAICINDVILKKLTASLERPTKKLFAPRFGIKPVKGKSILPSCCVFDWEHQDLVYKKIHEGDEFTVASYSLPGLSLVPSQKYMEKHNRILGLSNKKLARYVRDDYRLIFDSPLMWARCSEVTGWLVEMEKTDSEPWKQLRKDERAMSYALAWRSFIKHMGDIGSAAIFLFDDLECHYMS